MRALFWFRSDLRLFDNTSLFHALEQDRNTQIIYIYDEKALHLGGASQWWLHKSLQKLSQDISNLGGRLNIFKGDTREILENLIHAQNITHVFWNRRYEPALITLDTSLKESLKNQGVQVQTHNASLLFEPFAVASSSTKKPFQVFTPFWKRCLELGIDRTIQPLPQSLTFHNLSSATIEDLNLLPKHPNWAGGLEEEWIPGEEGAEKRLEYFLNHAMEGYKDNRNIPSILGTSKLSPHLHFGEISISHIVKRVHQQLALNGTLEKGGHHFLSELGWREFSYHLLYHLKDFENIPLRKEFLNFPWSDNQGHLKAWQRGQTGYPIVDAGMRELWQTGWMHNRVRMIVASFLVKDLFIHWREGAAWFMDTLVDADIANNTEGWQWVSGCGADAAPYFRIFNPTLQSEKFDPEGTYIKKYIPELSKLPSKYIHAPWLAPIHILKEAGIILGKTYPRPIVDHDVMRKKALEAYKSLREEG